MINRILLLYASLCFAGENWSLDKKAFKISHLNEIGLLGWHKSLEKLPIQTTFIFPLEDIYPEDIIHGVNSLNKLEFWRTIGHPFIRYSLFPCTLDGEYCCVVLEREGAIYKAKANLRDSTLRESHEAIAGLFFPEKALSSWILRISKELYQFKYPQIPISIWDLYCIINQSQYEKVQYSVVHFDDSVNLFDYFAANFRRKRRLTDSPYYIIALEYFSKMRLVLVRFTMHEVIFCEPNTKPADNLANAIYAFQEIYPFRSEELAKILKLKLPCSSCACVVS